MNIAEIFIRRPIATTLLMAAMVLFGVIGYFSLPISELPSVDFPTISVSASLPGASPETMAATVATPLERQFSTIPGLDNMSSSSSQGKTSITLQFDLDRSVDAAAQDVQAAISAAGRQLPPSMPTPPTFRKVNPASSPILFMSLSSDVLPISQVDQYAETNVSERLSTISGVAQVNVYGAQKYAVRVEVDPKRLAGLNLGIDDISSAINKGNTNRPTGQLFGPHANLPIQAQGQLTDAEAYRQLPIAYRHGAPVHLSDVGEVFDSVENDQTAAWSNGKRGVVLAIQRQPGTNTIAVVDAIRKVLPQLKAQMPGSVDLTILHDRSESIRASVNDVQITLLLTGALVVLVIFVFLRNVGVTLIPALALPTAIIVTFGVMNFMHFSLDNLSLMSLTLCTGFVVDDAIVVLENIMRHVEAGENRLVAALKGSGEISFTIVAMTTSLVAVFIPLIFMGGIIGRLFNEFALTITTAIVASGIVSLTLTPMLASRWIAHPTHEGERNPVLRAFEQSFNWMQRTYSTTLDKALAHRRVILAIFFAGFALSAYLFTLVPKGFLPSEDSGLVRIMCRAVPGVSFQDLEGMVGQAKAIVAQDPNVQNYIASAGGGPGGGSNTGFMFLSLKPYPQRHLSTDQVIAELRPKLAHIPGLSVFLMNPPSINIGGHSTRSQYELALVGPDLAALQTGSQALQAKLAAIPGLVQVSSEAELASPQLDVKIDRERAAALGVSADQIENAMSLAYGEGQISQIYTSADVYQVILQVLPQYQADPAALSMLYVRSNNGTLVPLGEVASITRDVGPLSVTHLGQLPSVSISFDLKPGVSLSDVTSKVMAAAQQTLPPDVSASFQGSAQVFQDSFSNLGLLLLLAVVVIYIVLGMLYESFIHPITVLSGLPAAGVGALLFLLLFGRELDLYGFVGLIMLIGIVKKNAIMMVDFAIDAERRGLEAAEAIHEACLIRFRPIMMTTAAALMGTLPIALGLGQGGSARQSLGLAVVGGLLVSQLLTLYITPVIYIGFARLAGRLRRKPVAEAVLR
ncbi:MAG TPA: efflux RND transporter permease subunit [Oscillatoriaceae cyanobacterium]